MLLEVSRIAACHSHSTGMSSFLALSKHSCCGCNLPRGVLLFHQPAQFGSRYGNNGVEGWEKKLLSEGRAVAAGGQTPLSKSTCVQAVLLAGAGASPIVAKKP